MGGLGFLLAVAVVLVMVWRESVSRRLVNAAAGRFGLLLFFFCRALVNGLMDTGVLRLALAVAVVGTVATAMLFIFVGCAVNVCRFFFGTRRLRGIFGVPKSSSGLVSISSSDDQPDMATGFSMVT